MATATSTAPAAAGAGGNQNRGGPRGGPRGRGGDRGGRGGERGGRRGGRGSRERAAGNSQRDSAAGQPPPPPGGHGVLGARLTQDAAQENRQPGADAAAEAAAGDGDQVEAEVCFICASPVAHHSVAPCNHRTCYICALRLRALYKTKACAHCRTEAQTVIFTDDAEKRYEDYDVKQDCFREDKNLGICYAKRHVFEDTVILLRYNCPETTCDAACLSWPDLHRHVRSVHQKWMCDLCTRNKKAFTHEHELFTKQDLQRHEKFGDDQPGAVNQSGFKGHPECGFCRQRFYGGDELFAHCRDRHERCHLCDRRSGGNNPQYYQNYEALEQHFGKEHFPCLDAECLGKKFVVFESEMDLKAHQLENHPHDLSKDARRDARRVDISTFNYRSQYEDPRRGGGRRGGRGRDPNAEPLPASSGGHMSRAQLAHQREREIHSAQSIHARSFGGSLSQPDHAPAPSRPVASPRPTNTPPATAAASSSAPQSPRPAATLTPAGQARQLRHNAVTERASTLLRNDKVKLDKFRERISAYTKNSLSAGDLIDALFTLIDTSSDQLGKLVKELADIFEVPGKREGLLKAWSDWKAINEDYPSLPGAAAANNTAAGVLGQGVGSSRVLSLKNSTAQSLRSGVATRYSSAAGSSAANPFPSLPPRNGGPATKAPASVAPTPHWLATGPSGSAPLSATPSTSARASPAPSRVQSLANLSPASGFPALPAAEKPTSTVFSPGYTGRGVIRTDPNHSAVNAWTLGAAGTASDPPSPPPPEQHPVTKKGKKGKQVVFKWG